MFAFARCIETIGDDKKSKGIKKKMINIILPIVLIILITVSSFAQQGAEQPDKVIDGAARTEAIDTVLKKLNDAYVFPDIAKKMEADIRTRLQNKEYDTVTSAKSFAQKLTNDLQSVSRDKHLRVRYFFEPIPVVEERKEPTTEEKENQNRRLREINFGFERVERLQGNIGYIDLRGFSDPEAGAETVAAAMSLIANTDALIFDLRQNGGGSPAMVALISSYLFGDKPVLLNTLYLREGNKTQEFWTKADVAGKKYGNKDIYVLTSNRTFSAAEEFSYNLKNLKRATIVGETTGGGAHPGRVVRISEHFKAFIPHGRAISPITKTNWEGTGVEPDVKVSKEEALKTAHLMAINKIAEKTSDAQLKNALKQLTVQLQNKN